MNKAEARAVMKAKRSKLTESDKQVKDNAIFMSLINDSVFIDSKIIFIYVSFGKEVDTLRIINFALSNNKIVCVPKVIGKTGVMKALKIDSLENMGTSDYGILEPQDNAVEISKDEIDLVLVPGLAFDLNGGRLGYGGGYYDRFLSKIRKDALKIGLAYDFQIVEEIYTEEFDILINGIISESGLKKWGTRKII